MKLHALFEQLIDQEPKRREDFLQELAVKDPGKAQALRDLLEADERADDPNANLLEPNPAALLQLSRVITAQSTFGGFELIKPLGQGGMGEVWLGERAAGAAKQRAAIKILRFQLGQIEARVRFAQEQKMIASLNHPFVAKLIDAGHEPGEPPWIAMEYVDGLPILEWADQNRLSVSDRLKLFLDVLDAVAHAHAQLIVHRDIKSSNVMVGQDGKPKLLDFGIAKLMGDVNMTSTAQRYFSVGSVAPEQYSGERTTIATDVYQLGLLLYHLLSGRPAYQLGDLAPADLQEYVLHRAPKLPSEQMEAGQPLDPHKIARARGLERSQQLKRVLSGDLDRIVLYSLRKNPKERYRSTHEFSADLRAYLEGRAVSASGQSAAYRTQKFLRRHWLPASLTALATVLALGFVAQLVRRDFELSAARTQAVKALTLAQKERDRAQNLNTFLLELFRSASPSAAGKKPLPQVVSEAITLQIQRKDFLTDPSSAFALAKAALGLGELAAAKQLLQALNTAMPTLNRADQRQLLLLHASIANLEADFAALRIANAALAPLMNDAPEADRHLFIGYVGQALIDRDPERVLRFTNLNPVPVKLVRLRARALLDTKRVTEAITLLEAAQHRAEATALESLSIAQTLTNAYAHARQYGKAVETGKAMAESARRVFGNSPRVVQFVSSYAEALRIAGHDDLAIEQYKQALAVSGTSEGQRRVLIINQLLTMSRSPANVRSSFELADQLWKGRDQLNMTAKAYAQLIRFRVCAYRQTKSCTAELDFAFKIDEPEQTELQTWRSIQLKPAIHSEVLNALQAVGSRDELLRLEVGRIRDGQHVSHTSDR
jgi:serine/threonine protein kinase